MTHLCGQVGSRQGDSAAPAAFVTVVLLRHGRSIANEQGTYSGWSDPPLGASGRAEVRHAGRRLRLDQVRVDVAHTSLLERARHSMQLVLHAWHQSADTVTYQDWRLNERHLGLTEGLTRDQVIERWGNLARQGWRSDPWVVPPAVRPESPAHPRNQARYRHVPAELLPGAESIAELTRRVLDYWHTQIAPDIAAGRNVLVVAHRDSLRAIIGHLEGGSGVAFADLPIPTAQPIRYQLDPARPCTPV